ncbi:hypothetical protein F511_36704 [Dorcoceras hygrometricum]|uniref:Uncharacterized protein n=1 Tax=Dorcoceras hygrometricum TaxID=472368 RepID=A0A2Z7BY32_9LAMI|nr:hypothetical protein F511_36704 [Dorcoceras hygrometricum]
MFPVVDLIKEDLPPLTLKSQIPCEFGWSQAPRRQQGKSQHPRIIKLSYESQPRSTQLKVVRPYCELRAARRGKIDPEQTRKGNGSRVGWTMKPDHEWAGQGNQIASGLDNEIRSRVGWKRKPDRERAEQWNHLGSGLNNGTSSGEAAVDPPKSGPRPETRLLLQPSLEGLTNLARTESPQHDDRNKSDHGGGGTVTRRWRRRPRGFWGGGAAANLLGG